MGLGFKKKSEGQFREPNECWFRASWGIPQLSIWLRDRMKTTKRMLLVKF